MLADKHRPQYHLLPPSNWMNDPNGLIEFQGDYHVFYQYNPEAPVPGSMHWGHAVSHDLVHWEHWPIALAPTPGGPDKDGCFSGCAVEQGGVPTLVYTGVYPEVQCLATSADGLRTWDKYDGNPVVGSPPEGLEVTGFRDPCVWREGNEWNMLIGSGIEGVGGTALLYRSEDLRRWEYLNPLCIGEEAQTGRVWECPDLFPLGHKHVLLISPVPLRRSLFLVGTFAEGRFVPENQGVVDDGGCYYAPRTLLDHLGRRLMWGWLWEGRSRAAQVAAGWAGVMSLPRVVSLRPNGLLGWEVPSELEALREEHLSHDELTITPDREIRTSEVYGDSLEILLRFAPAQMTTEYGLVLRCSPDGREQTRLAYRPAEGILTVDRSRSSVDEETERDVRSTRLELAEDEGLELHVFLDHSVLEVIAGNRACLSTRIYPQMDDSLGVGLFARGGMAQVLSLETWRLGSIW